MPTKQERLYDCYLRAAGGFGGVDVDNEDKHQALRAALTENGWGALPWVSDEGDNRVLIVKLSGKRLKAQIIDGSLGVFLSNGCSIQALGSPTGALRVIEQWARESANGARLASKAVVEFRAMIGVTP